MLSFTLWVGVTLLVTALTAATLQLGESVWSSGPLASVRSRLVAAGAGVALLVALTLALKVRALADADGGVVRRLADSRGDTMDTIMTYVTTMGDAIPTFTIAAMIALLVYRQGVHRVACWLLPVLVLIELYGQVLVGDVFHPLDIADIAASLPIGGEGYIPSGSVARLTSLVLSGALLLRATSPAGSRALVNVGALAIVLEIVSRLYLGRHFVLDIVGGLAFGLALFLVFSLCVRHREPRKHLTGS